VLSRTRDRRVVVDDNGHVWRVRPAPKRTAPKRRVDLRLLAPALAAWALIATTLGTGARGRCVAAVSLLAVGAAMAWWGRPRHRRGHRPALWAALCLCVMGMTLLAAGAADAQRRAGQVDDLARVQAVGRIEGRVVGEPIDIGNGRNVLRLKVESMTARGVTTREAAQILVVGDQRFAGLTWQQPISVLMRLRPADPAEPILAVGKPLAAPRLRGGPTRAVGWSAYVRERLGNAVADLPADAAGLVPAMVFGDTSRSPPELTDDMRDAGLAHLSAVSGANVSLLLVAVLPLLALVGVPRRGRPACLLVVIIAFVIVTRPEPSVIRAAVMGSIGVLAVLRSTRAAGAPALAAAIVVLLMVDPWLARNAGFALSVLATLGLVLFAAPWTAALAKRLPGRSPVVAAALVVPMVAQLATAPIVVILQGKVSVVGVPANILAAPLVAPVTIAGLVLAVLSSVGLPTGPLAWLPGAPALAIAEVAHRAAAVPWASVGWPEGAWGAALLAALTIAGLLGSRRIAYEAHAHPGPAVVALTLVLGGTLPVGSMAWPPGPWQLVACDVGQGDALVLATTPGHAVLVDAGPEPRAVDRCLRRLGVRVLDLVVLTHFHADHVDGLAGALRGRSTAAIVVSPVAEPADRVAAVHRLAGARGIPIQEAALGQEFALGPLKLRVLAPVRPIIAGSIPNNASIVLSAHSGDLDALLTGDIEKEAGAALRTSLLKSPAVQAHYDVVKAAHHGSANIDPELMSMEAAPLTLISVGADNDYGHPSPRLLELEANLGSTVLRTDLSGDIAVWVEGEHVLTRTTHR